MPDASPTLAGAVTDRIWPCVMLQWEWLGGLPPLRRAAVIGAGAWGTSLAVSLARAGLEVDLGCRTREQAAALAESRENDAYLPGVELPDNVRVRRAAELELGGHDLVCLAVPARALPAVMAAHGERIPARAGVVVVSKGLVPPLGSLAVGVRLRALPRSGAGGARRPHACRRCARARRVDRRRLAGRSFARQLRTRWAAPAWTSTLTRDVTGVELAGCAKNAAAFAAAAAACCRPERRRRRRRQGVRRGRRDRPDAAAGARRRSPGWPAPGTSSRRRSPRGRATAGRAS